MKGGIYPTHYEKGPKKGQQMGWQVRFGKITKRFKLYEKSLAERLLTGLRYETDRGTFDIRDYQHDNPLGFANKVEEFLHSKRLLKGVKKYEQRLKFAVDIWDNRNVKTIGFADIANLITELTEMGLSSKYRKDIRDCVKMFYRWLWNCGEITYDQIPKIPTVKVHMAYRNIIDKATQERILEEIKAITAFNPRIYIGCLFLATYLNVRPGELISIREKDIDLESGRILIRGKNSKTGEQKYILLLAADIQIIKSLGPSFGNLYFFRHIKGRGGNKPGSRFGKGYLYKYWKQACRNVGIIGVDLYGGTRHSSAVDLRIRHSPETVKRATQHATNEAFERYLIVQENELRGLYGDTRNNNKLIEMEDAKQKIR